jgi:nitroimidazol reductase NimA-like FMN-containing flavoprotein (pyridoxamine 5'-phosphate oxidase superfamily)
MLMDLSQTAREIIDRSLYMVLGTADEAGSPWVSPVYFAVSDYTDFYWVSLPAAQHSRNLAARPEVSIVVFDSTVQIGTGQGVYMTAHAEELTGSDLERGIDVFSRRSLEHGGKPWNADDVRHPAPHRFFRASATQHWTLDPTAKPGDQRTSVIP